MTRHARRLVLVLVRFQNAVDALHERWAETASCERAFDGGEFSGPAIERALAQDRDRLARRFGFAGEDVALEVARHMHALTGQPWWMYEPHAPVPLP